MESPITLVEKNSLLILDLSGMVLTRTLQRPRTASKIFSSTDRCQWAVLLIAATATPLYSMYYLFSAGGAAAADSAVSGTIDGPGRLAELQNLDPVKNVNAGKMTIL